MPNNNQSGQDLFKHGAAGYGFTWDVYLVGKKTQWIPALVGLCWIALLYNMSHDVPGLVPYKHSLYRQYFLFFSTASWWVEDSQVKKQTS